MKCERKTTAIFFGPNGIYRTHERAPNAVAGYGISQRHTFFTGIERKNVEKRSRSEQNRNEYSHELRIGKLEHVMTEHVGRWAMSSDCIQFILFFISFRQFPDAPWALSWWLNSVYSHYLTTFIWWRHSVCEFIYIFLVFESNLNAKPTGSNGLLQ